MANLDLSGMTVNERLFTCGLIDAFDQAAKRRDRESMVALLSEVEVGSETADTILRDPKKYGY
ncbi:hypothetical protein [Caulobacter segnis]|uniref:hypothetical protein n=1 Tax=Caulobacter segnis TaxID=88688 RepID=UPI00240F79DC|nr:hypothetical protein [Caulobacter segnis]